ncbi:hypothetical protein M378DRAFT_423628 [Amanita muscaria Koide BX008]|uniref:Uncharacterized protein n=1 Tax=Amanita muscaria (strain Koide BX008) TaxID=946122 RepID=A0A0C2WLB3_AMAMK|nr:hypothetical protein M378DRAFT_423628 [Amanita muscaria Koide BX008]
MMAFSLDNILAIATDDVIKLYNVKTHSFISTPPFRGDSIAFSPDCTRLAVGIYGSDSVRLLDTRGISASGPPSKRNTTAVAALALSRDCSRVACGFKDGTVELWGTSPSTRRLGPQALRSKMEAIFFRIFRQSRHAKSVRALGFDPDGGLFASGSWDGTIKLWNGGDGSLRGTLKVPNYVQGVALSNSVLVAAGEGGVTLWSLDTLSPIHTFKQNGSKVSIAENSALIAVSDESRHESHVALLDAVNRTTIATFNVTSFHSGIHTMTFLPDNSQLMVHSFNGDFLSLDPVNKRIIHGATLENLIQFPDIPRWHGVPIWHCRDSLKLHHYFEASFSQHKSPVPVLWIPNDLDLTVWAQGSSIIALGCEDGRVVLLRLPTSHE